MTLPEKMNESKFAGVLYNAINPAYVAALEAVCKEMAEAMK